jgi:hypothetical protein
VLTLHLGGLEEWRVTVPVNHFSFPPSWLGFFPAFDRRSRTT